MLSDAALSRLQGFNQGGLPGLTPGLNTQGLPGTHLFNPAISGGQQFIGPQGFGNDAPINPPSVPDFVGDFQNANQPAQGKGGTGTMQIPGQNPAKGGSPQNLARGRIPGSPQDFGKPSAGVLANQPDQVPPQGKGGFNFGQPPPTAGPIPQLGQLSDVQQGGFEESRGRVEQALFDRQMALLQPGMDQQQQRLQQDLANRGIPRDSEAGRRELDAFRTSRNQQFGNIANQAILGGGQEQSRLFGQQLQGTGFNNQNQFDRFGAANQSRQAGLQDIAFANQTNAQARDAALQAQLQQANLSQANRATQFNELASLLGLSQVAQPGLNNFFAPANADVTGGFALNQQAQAGNANRAAGMKGGLLGGATDLGGAAIGGK
jgi:hypothetical protein